MGGPLVFSGARRPPGIRQAGNRHDSLGSVAFSIDGDFQSDSPPVGTAQLLMGVLHPEICLPAGIDRLLTKSELKRRCPSTKLAHAKKARQSNLADPGNRSLFLLWFSSASSGPPASRLALYRELSCDEACYSLLVIARNLVSALAKTCESRTSQALLQATVTSFMSHRLSHGPFRNSNLSGQVASSTALLTVAFGAMARSRCLRNGSPHTACCFVNNSSRKVRYECIVSSDHRKITVEHPTRRDEWNCRIPSPPDIELRALAASLLPSLPLVSSPLAWRANESMLSPRRVRKIRGGQHPKGDPF